jgi:hypothetical protein
MFAAPCLGWILNLLILRLFPLFDGKRRGVAMYICQLQVYVSSGPKSRNTTKSGLCTVYMGCLGAISVLSGGAASG